MRISLWMFVSGLLILPSTAQVITPGKEIFIKGRAGAPATAPTAAPASALASVQIAKAADGKWKCLGTGGRPCSEPEKQAVAAIVKSRSNVKDNLIVAPDGTVQCTTMENKPCADTAFQAAAAEVNKAITKGGPQN